MLLGAVEGLTMVPGCFGRTSVLPPGSQPAAWVHADVGLEAAMVVVSEVPNLDVPWCCAGMAQQSNGNGNGNGSFQW